MPKAIQPTDKAVRNKLTTSSLENPFRPDAILITKISEVINSITPSITGK